MSFSIPHQIEQDIICGKAVYRTFQTGNGGQSILQVPTNSYAVIYGYDFSPAGGGFILSQITASTQSSGVLNRLDIQALRFFETQQISFYTGSDFYPFIHHVDTKQNTVVSQFRITDGLTQFVQIDSTIDNTPISRQVYITSTNDVTITHGLILNSISAAQNAIPITNRTPQALTYGGVAQAMTTQTNFGPLATPQQFMQPSPKDFQDFGFGLLPGNADSQAFATPDATNGLYAASSQLKDILGQPGMDAAAANYFLCIHYALYSAAIPEQRG